MTKTISYPKYPAYKDSGVEWLGEVPAHWRVTSNKYVFELKKDLVGKESDKYELLSLTLKGIIKRDMENPEGKFPSDFDTYQKVEKGDFIFCLFDVEETPRTVGLSPFDGMITGAYTIMQSSRNEDSRYLYYLFFNLDSGKRLKFLYKGLRNTIPKEKFFSLKIPLPPKPEQTAIAHFLDDKTTKIDRAIAQKERLIELLQERKQIIIQEAVTGKTVWSEKEQAFVPLSESGIEVKESGVEWIGEVPAHWEVVRSKYLFNQRKERALKKDIQLSATQAYGVIPQDEYEKKVGRRVVKIQFHLEKRKHVEADDFVISMRSFQGGLERAWSSGCIRSSYVVLKPAVRIDPTFYSYLFKAPRYIRALQATANFIRDGQDLNYDNFSKVDLFTLPVDEQKLIAKFIKSQHTRIYQAITLQQSQIEKLREYKATLIDSAVRGKIKVS